MEEGGAAALDYKIPGSHIDEDDGAKMPLRHRLTLLANTYIRSSKVQVFICTLTAASCFTYVVDTYVTGDSESRQDNIAQCRDNPSFTLRGDCAVVEIVVMEWFELLFGISFCFDYLMCLFYSASMLSFVFSTAGFCDLLSIVPMIKYFIPSSPLHSLSGFLPVLRAFKAARVLRLNRVLTTEFSSPDLESRGAGGSSRVTFEVASLCLTLLSILYMAASLLYSFNKLPKEYLPEGCDASFNVLPEDLTWDNFLYFVIVTLSTVGYGDIFPDCWTMKLVMVVFIGWCIIYIPVQFSRIQAAMDAREKYLAPYPYHPAVVHILLCGHLSPHTVRRFMIEFEGSANSRKDQFVKVVLLCPDEPDTVMLSFLRHPRYKNRMFYVKGSPKRDLDLLASSAHRARSIFLLSNRSRGFEEEETFVLMSSIAIEKFLLRYGPEEGSAPVQLVAQALSIEGAKKLADVKVNVPICLEAFMADIMAFGAQYPGFIPLFTNLIRTADIEVDQTLGADAWLSDYVKGSEYEIYCCGSQGFGLEGLYWDELCKGVYAKSNRHSVMIGVAEHKDVIINPGKSYRINKDTTRVFVLAEDHQDAEDALESAAEQLRSSPPTPRKEQSGDRATSDSSRSLYDPMLSPTAHQNLNVHSSIRPAVDQLQSELREPLVTDRIEASIGRLLREYRLCLGDDKAAASAGTQRILEPTIHKIELEHDTLSTGKSAIREVSGFGLGSLDHDDDFEAVGHIVLVFPGSDTHILQSVRIFITRIFDIKPRNVVLIHPEASTSKAFAREIRDHTHINTARFRFIHGSPADPVVLRRARVARAHAVISFAAKEEAGVGAEADDHNMRTAIVLERELKAELYEKVFTMNELINETSVSFLRQYAKESRRYQETPATARFVRADQREQRTVPHLFQWPLFAAGRVCTQSILDTLLIRLSNSLQEAEFWNSFFCKANLFASLPIPKQYQTYGQLFQHCVDQDLVPLGLYRPTGTKGSLMPYTHTNPVATEPLVEGDLLFVMPKGWLGET